MSSLIFILNILSELNFLKEENVEISFTLLLNNFKFPALIFEMFPFIILMFTQFFIKIFENNNEIEIFKYSGINNLNIITICFLFF